MSTFGKKLVVFGGNGFLGKRICEAGVKRGMQVLSVSTSGKMPDTATESDREWMKEVSWNRADIFRPESYTDLIKDAFGVAHSIGILLENQNYKKVVRSTGDMFGLIESFFAQPDGNPMKRSPPKSSQLKDKKDKKTKTAQKQALNEQEDEIQEDEEPIMDMTYDRMNKQSALVLAQTLVECNKQKPAFIYISADRGFPGVPSGYIESKRQAEYELYQLQPAIRPVLMRPGFMYDEKSANNGMFRNTLKDALSVGSTVNKTLFRNALDGLVRPPISTQTVAKWAVEKALDEKFHGPVLMDQMLHIKLENGGQKSGNNIPKDSKKETGTKKNN